MASRLQLHPLGGGEPQWKHVACRFSGPSEFPYFTFENTDTVTFPAGASILYVHGAEVREFPLTVPLPVGHEVRGPQTEAYAGTCAAVGKL